jgi:small subunit ribosomal protein S2e
MSEEKKEEKNEQPQEASQPKRSRGRGGRGFGRGGNRQKRGGRQNEEIWTPLTNLGRLVRHGQVTSLEEIFHHSIPIKEYQIVDWIFAHGNGDKKKKIVLKEECMKIKSVQKQTKAGQRTRFKAVVAIGDGDGHIGVGSKVAKEVQIAMKGATIAAKLNVIPVRRGYWGDKIGKPHTIATKITGKCGSVRLRFIPAPRGTGIVGAPPTIKLLDFAGIEDIFSQSKGNTDTMENFVRAIYDALYKSYKYLTPDLWYEGTITENLFSLFSEKLKEYKNNKDDKNAEY